MLITLEDVAPLLLSICPSALHAWETHLRWWCEDDRGYFNDIAVFAHHIVDSYTAGRTSEFPAFFAMVERLITEGDEHVRELATIGLLEDIQNVASHRPFGYSVFVPWLGPVTIVEWRAVEAMWQGKRSLMDVIRSEKRRKR